MWTQQKAIDRSPASTCTTCRERVMLDYYPNLRTNNASAARHRISHDIRIVSSTAASQHKFSHQKIRLASKKPHGSVLPAPPGRESNSGGVRSGLRFGTSDIHCHDFSALASQQLNKLMKAQQPSSWSRGTVLCAPAGWAYLHVVPRADCVYHCSARQRVALQASAVISLLGSQRKRRQVVTAHQ